ncbi:hypothetical protein LTR37_006945 [Vermiconidia calcicola]|uniref:Uncharacterized protein n=1 Tax=Vermiconidia calcicola TaxID=1690605 RepID=A0ACC3NEU9_9PEZI|nr:hypothetical protein LTR37_006945 [Vermiconidia calcicola]
MQVQQQMHSPYHTHAHPPPGNQNHTHTNGTHTEPRQQHHCESTNGHFEDSEMQPYHNQYAGGQGHPQQQRQYSSNQLPPMYPSASMPPPMAPPPGPGMAGPSGGQHSQIYPAAAPPSQMQPAGRSGDEQPKFLIGSNGKHRFELRVEQQPQRARMCGFGDKDRRPITPPPCVRLVITDLRTGLPVPHEDIEGTFFVLQVDLWDDTATREVNIVRSSSSSPAVSISTATTTSYPPTTPERPLAGDYQPVLYQTADGQAVYGPPQGYPMPMSRPSMSGGGYPQMGYYQPQYGNVPGPGMQYITPAPQHAGQQPNHSMFTRNLIGSLTVNASSLKDTDGQMGFWFVLQDLSVRTEGWFRLRMNFIDVGAVDGQGLNKMKAPILAYVFSDKFQVYSAKKFPGVIESTPLSKCFAQQGIKIPIRKDLKPEREADEDD